MRSVARTRANHGLLSRFLSRGRANQRALVFSGIFAMVEAVGTLRINLFLWGNKYVNSPCSTSRELLMACLVRKQRMHIACRRYSSRPRSRSWSS